MGNSTMAKIGSFHADGSAVSCNQPGSDAKMCKRCNVALVPCKSKPWTATDDGHLYFDYWQCPKCHVNSSLPKS